MPRPFIIVVTGRPGSGKTTLAHTVAQRIHCPALCRDEFKEGYVHTLGGTHASLGTDLNQRLYDIFFETVAFVVAKQISIVIEAAFQHAAWAPKLIPLRAVAHVSLIVCTTDPQRARVRWRERLAADPTRERFHGERVVTTAPAGSELVNYAYHPPAMDVPTLMVDTTDGYRPTLDHIIAFALAAGG
jgi:predicted kinase